MSEKTGALIFQWTWKCLTASHLLFFGEVPSMIFFVEGKNLPKFFRVDHKNYPFPLLPSKDFRR
jgi:hypothetical protein